MISWRILVSLRGFVFEDYIFLHGEVFEFSWFFFCLKILFNVNGKATEWYWHPLFLYSLVYILCCWPKCEHIYFFHIFEIENFEIWQFKHIESTQLIFPSKPNFCNLLKFLATKFTQKSISSTSNLWKLWNKLY
jgi:hypothetical protein